MIQSLLLQKYVILLVCFDLCLGIQSSEYMAISNISHFSYFTTVTFQQCLLYDISVEFHSIWNLTSFIQHSKLDFWRVFSKFYT